MSNTFDKAPCIVTIYHGGSFVMLKTDIKGVSVLLKSLRQPVDPNNVKVATLQQNGRYEDTILDLFQ